MGACQNCGKMGHKGQIANRGRSLNVTIVVISGIGDRFVVRPSKRTGQPTQSTKVKEQKQREG